MIDFRKWSAVYFAVSRLIDLYKNTFWAIIFVEGRNLTIPRALWWIFYTMSLLLGDLGICTFRGPCHQLWGPTTPLIWKKQQKEYGETQVCWANYRDQKEKYTGIYIYIYIYDPGSRFATTPPPSPPWYGPKTCVWQHSAWKRGICNVFCMVGSWRGPQTCEFVGFLQPNCRKRVMCNVSASTFYVK